MFLYTILSKLTYNTDIQDQQCFSEEKYWFEASCQYLLQGKEERKNITIYCCSARQINSIFYQKKILLIKFENYQRVISAFCQCLIDSKLEFINPSRHFSSLLCHAYSLAKVFNYTCLNIAFSYCCLWKWKSAQPAITDSPPHSEYIG